MWCRLLFVCWFNVGYWVLFFVWVKVVLCYFWGFLYKVDLGLVEYCGKMRLVGNNEWSKVVVLMEKSEFVYC